MKQILLTATAVGATIAAIIIYNRKRSSGSKQVENAAKDAYKTMNYGLGKVERSTF
jgi:hypothetical protein